MARSRATALHQKKRAAAEKGATRLGLAAGQNDGAQQGEPGGRAAVDVAPADLDAAHPHARGHLATGLGERLGAGAGRHPSGRPQAGVVEHPGMHVVVELAGAHTPAARSTTIDGRPAARPTRSLSASTPAAGKSWLGLGSVVSGIGTGLSGWAP